MQVLWLDSHDPVEPTSIPEYYRRELGLVPFRDIKHARAEADDRPILAHLYTEPDHLKRLNGFPPKSVRLLLTADETYRPDLLAAIGQTPAIGEILRNYPLYRGSRGWSRRALGTATRELRISGARGAPSATRAVIAGQVMAYRMRKALRVLTAAGIPLRGLPLGYTDWFVRGLELHADEGRLSPLPNQGSLVPYLRSAGEHIRSLKNITLGFVGQSGNFQRRTALEAARIHGDAELVVRSAFGGGYLPRDEAAYEYVDVLLRSRFALCPPGNYSGESFRFTEACLLHGVPVASATTISDPLRPPSGLFDDAGVCAKSWAGALALTEQLSPDDVNVLAERSFEAVVKAMSEAAAQVIETGTLRGT